MGFQPLQILEAEESSSPDTSMKKKLNMKKLDLRIDTIEAEREDQHEEEDERLVNLGSDYDEDDKPDTFFAKGGRPTHLYTSTH
mmetsp:Transcript_40588/g.61844  ORF Transcript_40588/g.61844 Transcript_40588/m.61844 type:complete len:84 (+) Transcript_40588:1534-1785(+)